MKQDKDAILDAARACLRADPPAQADLEASIRAIDARLTASTDRVQALAIARADLVINGTYDQLVAHDRDASATLFVMDQAREIAANLRLVLAPIAAAAEEAERLAAIEAERDRIEHLMVDAGEEMAKLPRYVAAIRKMLGLVATADAAAKAFADANPDEPRISSAEERVRFIAPATKVLKEERVLAWVTAHGSVVAEELNLSIQPSDVAKNDPIKVVHGFTRHKRNFLLEIRNGQLPKHQDHVFRTNGGVGQQVFARHVVRREVERTPSYVPEPLAAAIVLPALRNGDVEWEIPALWSGQKLVASLDILARLKEDPAVRSMHTSRSVTFEVLDDGLGHEGTGRARAASPDRLLKGARQ